MSSLLAICSSCSIDSNRHSPSPSHKSPLLPAAPSSGAGPSLQFLQSCFSSVFFGCVDILPIVPVLGRNGLAADAYRAGPSSALAAAIGEDVVGRCRDAASCTMICVDVRCIGNPSSDIRDPLKVCETARVQEIERKPGVELVEMRRQLAAKGELARSQAW